MLEICTFLDKCADTTVIGIVPSDIETVSIALTKPLLDGFDDFIQTTLEHLSSIGTQYNLKPHTKTVNEVVELFLN
jgi:hypothetical protein